MSEPTNLNQPLGQQPPTLPRGRVRKALDGTKWAVGGIGRSVAWAFGSPGRAFGSAGDNFGSGLAGSMKKEFEEMVKPDGPLIPQLKTSVEQAIIKPVEQALLKQLPKEFQGLPQLKELIKKALETPDALTIDDVRLIHTHLKMLLGNQGNLLKRLSLEVSPEGIQPEAINLCYEIATLFQTTAINEHLETDPNVLNSLKRKIKGRYLLRLQQFNDIFNKILDCNQGAFIQAMSLLNQTFVAGANVFQEKVEQLDETLTRRAHHLLSDSRKKLIELQQAINDSDRIAIQKSSRELEQILEQMLAQPSTVFTKKSITREDIFLLDQLKNTLHYFYSDHPYPQGVMLSGVEIGLSTIDRYYDSHEGTAGKISNIITGTLDPLLIKAENISKGFLADADKKLSDQTRSILSNLQKTITDTLDPLLAKAGNMSRDFLADADEKLSDQTRSILSNLQKTITNTLDPLLTKAENISKGFLADADSKLSEQTHSILSNLQKTITDTLDPLLTKAENISKGFLADADKKLSDQTRSILSNLQKTITDTLDPLLTKAENISKGFLADADAKLNDQAHYLLPEVCNKLIDLRQAINGNNKAAIRTMSSELKQLLVRMLENKRSIFTKTALTDEHEGLLDRFTTLVLPHFYSDDLYDHDEMLASVEFALSIIEPYYNEHEGTIGRASNALHRRITATFDDILKKANAALNRRAHHLLPDTRRKLSELRQLINDEDNDKVIKKSMSELERLLRQMLANEKRVFTKTPLANDHRTQLNQLQENLHHYYGEDSPDRERMLRDVEIGYRIIHGYYINHQGTFGQTLDTVQQTATNTGKVLLGHAKKMAKEVISDEGENLTGGEAYRLLSNGRKKLNELKTAIISKKKESIRKLSREVEQCLQEIKRQSELGTLFTKPPISIGDVHSLLYAFKEKLPSFYSGTPPDQNSMRADVVTALSTIEPYCVKYEGTVAQIGEIFVEKLDPFITRLENLGKTNINNIFGKMTSDDSADAGASNGEGTVSDFLSEGGALLEQILGKGTEAISKRALGGLASILTLGLQHVIDKMGDSADFLQPKMALNGIIMLIGGVRENGNWQGLWKHLKDVAVVMRPIKIYMNGFLLPRIGSGESEAYRLLSGARKELNALKKGIDSNDNGSIQTASNALRKLLEEIKAESNTVFKKIPITEESHVNALNALIERLPRGADGIPPDQKEATLGVIKTGLATLEHYCGRYEGEVEKAEEVYFDQVNALQKAKDTSPVDPDDQNWEKLAEVEKTKLVKHTTKFLTIKHIYENICHLNPDDGERFYVRLLIKSQQNTLDPDGELKKLFFEELENKKVNFLIRLYARIQYFFYSTIVGSYVAEASNIYFNEIFDYIKQHKEEKFDTLRNQVTTNFTRYLTILGEAYRNVAKNPTATGTLTEMLKSELEKKESNLGFESKELYSQFAQIVIRKTLKSRFLSWLGEKFIGDPEKIVRTVIDKSLDSLLNTNGYTHALNIVIREQLQEIWTLLQADEASGQSTFTPETLRLSDVRKSELSGLVKNFFEILSKSKCQTKDELRNLIKGQILSKKINQGIDSLFIEEIIEKVTDLLAFVLQSLAEKDQPQKLTYKFASLVNRTYEVDEQVTLQDMQAEERKISKLSEQILGLAVNTAVKEQFDFTGNQQQEETDHFVHELQGRFTTFYTLKEDLVALKEEKGEIENKIDGILEKTQAFTTQCYDLSFQVRSSKINSDNKEDLDKQYLGLAHLSGPLVEAVIQLKNHHQVLKNIQAIVPPLSQIRKIAGDVPPRLSSPGGPTNEDLTFCDNQLFILDNTHLKELKKMRYLPELAELVEKIDAAQRVFATTLIDVRDQIKIKAFSTAQSQPNSLLEQIAKEKKESLGSIMKNEALASKLATLTQEVKNTFDKNKKLLTQLVNKLKEIENANSSEKIDAATKDFIRLYQQAMIEANVSIETLKGNYNRSHQRLLIDINGTGFLNPNQDETSKRGIQDSIQHAQEHLETLATWKEQHVKKVAHIDFAVPEIMKRLQDFASRFVGGRVKERLDGFMSFLKREETYRYGLINHLSMIPYVQANQPKN